MSIDDSQIKNTIIQNELSDLITCQICYQIQDEPQMCIDCQNTLCKHHTAQLNNTCPYCRQCPLTLVSNRNMQEFLDKVKVHCKNRSQGCNANLSLAGVLTHERNCQICDKCCYIGTEHSLTLCSERRFNIVLTYLTEILADVCSQKSEIERFNSAKDKMAVIVSFRHLQSLQNSESYNIQTLKQISLGYQENTIGSNGIDINKNSFNRVVGRLIGHKGDVNCLMGNEFLQSCSCDNKIQKWRLNDGVCELKFEKENSGPINSIITDEQYLQSGSDDNFIRKWDINDGRCILSIDLANKVNKVVYQDIMDYKIISMSEIKKLKNNKMNNYINLQKVDHNSVIKCLAIDNNGYLFNGSSNSIIQKWNVINGEFIDLMVGHTDSVNALSVNNQGYLFSGSSDSQIKKWSCSNLSSILTMKGHKKSINSIFIDKNQLFSASSDKTIRKWRCNDGFCEIEMNGHSDAVMALTVDNQGILYSASADKYVKVFNPLQGFCINTIEIGGNMPTSMIVIENYLYVAEGNKILLIK